jgi:hypothetical protein
MQAPHETHWTSERQGQLWIKQSREGFKAGLLLLIAWGTKCWLVVLLLDWSDRRGRVNLHRGGDQVGKSQFEQGEVRQNRMKWVGTTVWKYGLWRGFEPEVGTNPLEAWQWVGQNRSARSISLPEEGIHRLLFREQGQAASHLKCQPSVIIKSTLSAPMRNNISLYPL